MTWTFLRNRQLLALAALELAAFLLGIYFAAQSSSKVPWQNSVIIVFCPLFIVSGTLWGIEIGATNLDADELQRRTVLKWLNVFIVIVVAGCYFSK